MKHTKTPPARALKLFAAIKAASTKHDDATETLRGQMRVTKEKYWALIKPMLVEAFALCPGYSNAELGKHVGRGASWVGVAKDAIAKNRTVLFGQHHARRGQYQAQAIIRTHIVGGKVFIGSDGWLAQTKCARLELDATEIEIVEAMVAEARAMVRQGERILQAHDMPITTRPARGNGKAAHVS